MKKFLSLLLAGCMFLALFAISPIASAAGEMDLASYSDVPETHRAYKAVEYVAGSGIMSGYPDGTFNPDGSLRGSNVYLRGSGTGIIYVVQKESAKLADVKVGETALIKDREYKTEGSATTVITLFPAYLNTLSTGTYTLTVSFTDKTFATVQFAVEVHKNPFADVANGVWYYDAVMYVFVNGLMVGTAVDMFNPDYTLTRAMIVTILYRNAGSPDVSGLVNPFSDVPANQWFADAVKWGADNGIVTGYGNGKFGPNDPVTKEQLAVLIYRTQQSSDKIPPDILADYEHPDWDKISDWAKSAVNKLTLQGVFRDIPGINFNPKNPATRSEVASILYRWLTAIKA